MPGGGEALHLLRPRPSDWQSREQLLSEGPALAASEGKRPSVLTCGVCLSCGILEGGQESLGHCGHSHCHMSFALLGTGPGVLKASGSLGRLQVHFQPSCLFFFFP